MENTWQVNIQLSCLQNTIEKQMDLSNIISTCPKQDLFTEFALREMALRYGFPPIWDCTAFHQKRTKSEGLQILKGIPSHRWIAIVLRMLLTVIPFFLLPPEGVCGYLTKRKRLSSDHQLTQKIRPFFTTHSFLDFFERQLNDGSRELWIYVQRRISAGR